MPRPPVTRPAKAGSAMTIGVRRGGGLWPVLAILLLATAHAAQAQEKVATAEMPSSDDGDVDWSVLETDPMSLSGEERPVVIITRKPSAPTAVSDPWSVTRSKNQDGSSSVAVKQPLSPFWNARIGADLNVSAQTPTTSSAVLMQKIANNNQLTQSSGSAWAAVTAPGAGAIWDKTDILARTDPTQDQSQIGASLSKSVPIAGNRYSLTLQNGYSVTQQTLLPGLGGGTSTRIADIDQSATFGIASTGTSLLAGVNRSTADDKWLGRVGAEQTLFGGLTVTASVSETAEGQANRSLSAGFKRSW